MIISIIVAVTANNAIGAGGDLLFFIPDDLKRFKKITMGHPIIMGRKTFESLPKGPLPGRVNIVISRSLDAPADGAFLVARSLTEALELASQAPGGEQPFIIGGGQIYSQAFEMAARIYLTRIDAEPANADTFFPRICPDRWSVIESEPEMTTPDGLKYQFITLGNDTI